MSEENPRFLIQKAVLMSRSSPELQRFLLEKIVLAVREDRDFYRLACDALQSVHGGKVGKIKVPLSDAEKQRIVETFNIWRTNYKSDDETYEAMNDFSALGKKAIEAIRTEFKKIKP